MLALLLPLNGCITMGLWGAEYRVRSTPEGRLSGGFEPSGSVDWSWWRVGLRVVGTPGALALDVVTLPVQSLVIGRPMEPASR